MENWTGSRIVTFLGLDPEARNRAVDLDVSIDGADEIECEEHADERRDRVNAENARGRTVHAEACYERKRNEKSANEHATASRKVCQIDPLQSRECATQWNRYQARNIS